MEDLTHILFELALGFLLSTIEVQNFAKDGFPFELSHLFPDGDRLGIFLSWVLCGVLFTIVRHINMRLEANALEEAVSLYQESKTQSPQDFLRRFPSQNGLQDFASEGQNGSAEFHENMRRTAGNIRQLTKQLENLKLQNIDGSVAQKALEDANDASAMVWLSFGAGVFSYLALLIGGYFNQEGLGQSMENVVTQGGALVAAFYLVFWRTVISPYANRKFHQAVHEVNLASATVLSPYATETVTHEEFFFPRE